MRKIRTLPAPDDGCGRVETGPTVFGDDWPGTFIRGDNGMYYMLTLRHLIAEVKRLKPDATPSELFPLRTVERLADLLSEAMI